LYLPEEGAKDKARRKKTKIPVGFEFQTQPRIALEQFRQAVAEQVPHAAILADAAYGNDSGFREGISNLGLKCAVGVQSSVKVWQPGEGLLPTKE
jgi:SRSO17 transposase